MTSVSMWRIGHTSPLNCDFKLAEAHCRGHQPFAHSPAVY